MGIPGWLQAATVRALLWERAHPARVRRELHRRPYRSPSPVSGSTLRAAAVQRHIHLVTSAEQYAAEAYTLVAAAVAYGAQLICFPEYNGLHLLGLLPGAERLDPSRSLDEALVVLAGQDEIEPADLFRMAGPAARRVYETTWSTLARRFGVSIVAGSLLLPDPVGRLYNTLFAYGPDGRCLGAQRKLTIFLSEAGWISPGNALTLFHLPAATLAAPICTDHIYWETARAAIARGADVLVNPAADDEPYSWWSQARGLWARVQEVCAYGIQTMLVGDLFGFHFRGRSGIYGPLALSPTGDGILSSVEDEERENVVVADLDLAALRELRRALPRPRPELVRRALPRLYLEWRLAPGAVSELASGFRNASAPAVRSRRFPH